MEKFEFSPIKKLLFAVIKLAKKDMEKQFNRAKISVSPLQFWVLAKLASEALTINELARQFGIKPPSLIPVVDALEKAAYLQRKHDKNDHRKIQLLITKKGQQLVKKMPWHGKADGLHKAFSKLTPIKQKQLIESLQELIENFSL